MVTDYHQLHGKPHKRLNRLINHKLPNAQENHNMILSIFNMWFFTVCNYIDMNIIGLLRELLITINLSFCQKQEAIIVPVVGASQMCSRKNLEYRKNKKKKACHFFQASFLPILSGGRKGLLKIDQCSISGIHILLD